MIPQYLPFESKFKAAGGRCFVAGRAVQPEQLAVRAMNFEQYWRTKGMLEESYRVEVPCHLALERLEADLLESTLDAQRFPEPDDEFDAALRQRGWPAAGPAFADPVLAILIATHWSFELLLSFFGDGNPTAPGFAINTVDNVILDAGWFSFSGRAGRSELRTAYQDF